MAEPREKAVTQVLREVAQGRKNAATELLPLVYDELRALARARMARLVPGQTLQATALVHEAYLRVVGDADPGWDSRGHFFGAAARAMRDIIVEQARRKQAAKRGGGQKQLGTDMDDLPIEEPPEDVVALNEQLKLLEASDPRKGQVVNLHYFAGFTLEETAQLLGVSLGTVNRDWEYTRKWLFTRLAGSTNDEHGMSDHGQ